MGIDSLRFLSEQERSSPKEVASALNKIFAEKDIKKQESVLNSLRKIFYYRILKSSLANYNVVLSDYFSVNVWDFIEDNTFKLVIGIVFVQKYTTHEDNLERTILTFLLEILSDYNLEIAISDVIVNSLNKDDV